VQGKSFSFVVADSMGEIYYIANLSHQKRDFMEKGDIFPLEEVCRDCHGRNDFSDLAEAVKSGDPVHAVFRSPRGRLVNRTSTLFPVLNERWLVSVSVPYDVLQGQIDNNFNRNAISALLLLLLTGSGSLLLYAVNRQRDLENQYYSIVDSIDVGLCRIDDSGRILSANPAMEGILGRKRDEIEEGDFSAYCAEEHRVRQCVSALSDERPAANCEIQMVRGDGTSFEALVAAKRNPGNHIDLVVSDITDRKTAEAALRKAKDELEKQNEELKKVDRIKEALIGDVSHELKTPVAKQIMNLDILTHIHEQAGIKGRTEDIVESMVGNLRRQQSVIKNILMTSRLESGGRKFRFDAVRLDKLLESVVNEHLHSLSAHGIFLEQDLVEAVVGADEEMLWHVFANILDNAIKYRREEDPRIAVAMERKGGEVVVRIEDNGKGLSEEELKKAFERFYQSATSSEGIGLGLYICLTMLERMGGEIDLKSEGKGRGTTAEIRLPLG
jgi:PAS domain S-box-containing protein